jgi:hypothetical protein
LKLVEYPEAVTDIPMGEDMIQLKEETNIMIETYKKAMAEEKKKSPPS